MLQPRSLLHANSSALPLLTLTFNLSRLTVSHTSSRSPKLPHLSLLQQRHASHATQGRANGAKQGPGKRLGAKRGASELVVPGCIIFRQRGAKWWPGENCVMGRDHTISSLVRGYVRYYRDPENHPKRKLIGVVYEQDEVLPRPRNASRRRRLGLLPRVREEVTVVEEEDGKDAVESAAAKFTDGYQYRPSNTKIGLAAKESGRVYPVYKKGDRWLAWRLRTARRKLSVERKALRERTSAKKKSTSRGGGKGKQVVNTAAADDE